MTRGYSLGQDLRLLVNNPKYSDIEILCEDEKKLHACRAILAARSEVFDRLLYNGMKESYENQISFPKINSSGMVIILEYTYTGLIKEDSLTKDNIVEAFHAADYFQLPDLQDFIIKTVKDTLKKNYIENYSPELLSKVAKIMPSLEDHVLLNLLVDAVAIMPLNTIEFSRLSVEGLQCLLSCTHEKEKPFVTSEYDVFRYSAILASERVSNDTSKTLMERLPTLETLKQMENSVQVSEAIINHQKVAKELEPLVKLIDFKRMEGQILTDIIEPLEIIPAEIFFNAYRYIARSNCSALSTTRGMLSWDESACGSKLLIEDNGKVIYASEDCSSYQSVRTKTELNNINNKCIFEWDVIIEKVCDITSIGVCASENFNYEIDADKQWVLKSSGNCYHNSEVVYCYCPSFGVGAKITIHLDMSRRTCAFTVNGKKCKEISGWNDLPSNLYPVVSLRYPGRLLIENFNIRY